MNIRSDKEWQRDLTAALVNRPHGLSTKKLSQALNVGHSTIHNSIRQCPHGVLATMVRNGQIIKEKHKGVYHWRLANAVDPVREALDTEPLDKVQELEVQLIGVIRELAKEMAKSQLQIERDQNQNLAGALQKSRSETNYYKQLADDRKKELQAKRSIFGFTS
jgi:hypothetical protein